MIATRLRALSPFHFWFFLLLICSRGWTLAFGRGWKKNLFGSARRLASRTNSVRPESSFYYEPPFNYSCEVVGAFGRVGSFWLCHGADAPATSNGISSAAAVPRGLSPGCWTTAGCPIYVATPSAAWPQIWNQTLKERRQDLVFVGNGLPSPEMESATFVVPHFAILKQCRMNDSDETSGVQTTPISPKTYIFGRHASQVARILEDHGVQTERLETFSDIYEAAARKLLWASCMWLVCRQGATHKTPWTVSQVHEHQQGILDQLVDELYPALVELVGRPINRTDLDKYLRDYSMSIADAVPSLDLATAEVQDRNGIWLSGRSDDYPQELHQELIGRIAGVQVLQHALKNRPLVVSHEDTMKKQIRVDNLGLVLWGEGGPFEPPKEKVVIVGGGILGSSMAFYLAQLRPDLNITVLDQMPADTVGETTPASWAWLNANAKSPKMYQILNQLGMHAWKREPHLANVVSWMGSLVRFEESPAFVDDGGYPAEGPLSRKRILELEPLANWKISDGEEGASHEGHTFFFPDEGCVDPMVAVEVLRKSAAEKGVRFVANANVTSVARDSSTGKIVGVSTKIGETTATVAADVVIVAAGAGAAAKGLGCGLQLLHRPGAIAYANPSTKASGRLRRILVDPLRSSHVLQRPNGAIVAGGGALEVGGTEGTVIVKSKAGKEATSLLDGAKRLSPTVFEGATLSQTCEAVRPMPLDGLPVVGYVEDNLYVIVTHSGMTLGPLLCSMAAAEVSAGVSCDLLAPYRPSRFQN